ncbi:MAG: hypothetical protein ACOX4M_07680 [Acetivibrionales bacterium]
MVLVLLASCGSPGKKALPADGAGPAEDAGKQQMTEPAMPDSGTEEHEREYDPPEGENHAGNGNEQENNPDVSEGKNAMLLQSASVDLDGDGENEQVEVIQVELPSADGNLSGEIEERLIIKGASGERQISFWTKPAGLSWLLSSMQFEDLDNDGAKDVFLLIPHHGASFSLSRYFIYSYGKNLSYSFASDDALAEIISGFKTEHVKGSAKLRLVNEKYGFSAELEIENISKDQPLEEAMLDYVQRTWIEPVSVDISESSRLSLVKGAGNKPEIKVPLPIFGLATVDMIGELDLFYVVDGDFKPVLRRFEVMDFNGDDIKKAGSCIIEET